MLTFFIANSPTTQLVKINIFKRVIYNTLKQLQVEKIKVCHIILILVVVFNFLPFTFY